MTRDRPRANDDLGPGFGEDTLGACLAGFFELIVAQVVMGRFVIEVDHGLLEAHAEVKCDDGVGECPDRNALDREPPVLLNGVQGDVATDFDRECDTT